MSSHALITRNTLGLGLLSLSALAQAQTDTAVPPLKNYPPVEVINTPLEYRQFEKIEITGSSIIARQAKEALPVQVISRHEIERSGATNLPQLLQKLPTMFNFQELGSMTGTREGGPETVAIHGNAAGTLVLLNGRRLPSYGNQQIMLDRSMVDVNLVPVSAIERIEILTDGASSRYGSDAVAGVVNIITKASTKGLGISTEFTRPAGGFAPGQMVGLSWGTGRFEDSGYRLQAHFSAEKQNALLVGDVANARNAAVQLNTNGQTFWSHKNGITTHGWPAGIYDPLNGTSHPYHKKTGRCPDTWYTSSSDDGNTSCWRNMQTFMTLYPATEKQMLFVDGEIALSSGWRGFAQVIAGRQIQRSVPSEGMEVSYDLGNDTVALIDTSPLGSYRQRYSNSNHQAVVGIKGDLSGWDFRASASSGQHRVVRAYTDGLLISIAAFNAVELSASDLEQNRVTLSPALLAKYAAVKLPTEKLMDDGFTHLTAIDTLASREIGSTDDGPVLLGLGWNWRTESVGYSAPNYPMTRPSFSSKRQNWAAHAELQTPLNETQEATLAVRHDQYSDFGGVQTGKLGWRWRPEPGLMVRSSWGTGFRAPTLAQMTPVTSVLSTIYEGEQLYDSRYAGNPNLKPERSTQATLGFRWDPTPHWSIGADFWQLHIRNTFGAYNENQILDSPELRSQYISSQGGTNYINLTNLNLGRSERQGIDYDIQWRQPTDWGRMRLALRGTRNLQARKQIYDGSPFESELGRYDGNTQSFTSRQQLALSVGLERAEWSVLTALNYRSGFTSPMTLYTVIGGPGIDVESHVPGFWTVDLSGRWQPDRSWILMASVQNLTNRNPPWMHVISSVFEGVDTRFANYYGRTLKLKAEYKF